MSDSVKDYLDAVELILPRVFNRGSRENLADFPDALRGMLRSVNGQRSQKLALLPSPGGDEPHLKFLSSKEIIEYRSNNLGYNILFKSLNMPQFVGVDLGSRFWKDTWWPIARSEISWRALFLSSGTGQVFYQTWVGDIKKSRIERTCVGDSIDELFTTTLAKLRAGVFSIENGVGVKFRNQATVFSEIKEKAGFDDSPVLTQNEIIDAWLSVVKQYELYLGATFGSSEIYEHLPVFVPSLLRESYRFVTGWCWPLSGYDQITMLYPKELLDNREEDLSDLVSKSGKVKEIYNSELRINFAVSDYHLFQIDFDPTPEGIKGQILVIDLEEETVDYFCASIEAFFTQAISQMKERIKGYT